MDGSNIRKSCDQDEDAAVEDEDYIDCSSSDDEEIGSEVLQAHTVEDPLKLIQSSGEFTVKNGSAVIIKHYKVQHLSCDLLKWVMDLLKRNMKTLYEQSGGWKQKEKKIEMTGENSRYLIAFMNSKPVAFSHFQFDMDYGRQVLYCYEIQLEPDIRSCGLGGCIMQILEKIASATRLSFVVLTVFKHNQKAIDFFNRIGYDIDETCPEEEEKTSYFILSKSIKPKV